MMTQTLIAVALLLTPPQEPDEQKEGYAKNKADRKPASGDIVAVQVPRTGLRKVPNILSKSFHHVERGSRLRVREVKTAWLKVEIYVPPKRGRIRKDPVDGFVRTETVLPYETYTLTEGKYLIDPKDPNTFSVSAKQATISAKGVTPEFEAERIKARPVLARGYADLNHIQLMIPGGKIRIIDDNLLDMLTEFRANGNLGEFKK